LTVTTVPAIDAEVAPSITATPVGAGSGWNYFGYSASIAALASFP
jgi:hypothetical protein